MYNSEYPRSQASHMPGTVLKFSGGSHVLEQMGQRLERQDGLCRSKAPTYIPNHERLSTLYFWGPCESMIIPPFSIPEARNISDNHLRCDSSVAQA